MNESFGRAVRRRRLHHHHRGRLLVVALDHSVTNGPVARRGGLDRLVGQVAASGADAVVLHKGSLRWIDPQWFDHLSLLVHLSASTSRAADPDAKYLVTTVTEAIRLGADGVSVQVNLGSRREPRQIADLAAVAGACHRWSIPLLAMVYPRGPAIADAADPQLLRHAVIVAADLGADLVKTGYPGSAEAMATVVDACPIPVLVSGGPVTGEPDEALSRTANALRGGAAGMAIGRHIFTAADPAGMTRKLADLVHGHVEPAPHR
jgi:2-amino-4,5-dihydroxy-6-oxo-7-(phosphooxy)heptanoate synthase